MFHLAAELETLGRSETSKGKITVMAAGLFGHKCCIWLSASGKIKAGSCRPPVYSSGQLAVWAGSSTLAETVASVLLDLQCAHNHTHIKKR